MLSVTYAFPSSSTTTSFGRPCPPVFDCASGPAPRQSAYLRGARSRPRPSDEAFGGAFDGAHQSWETSVNAHAVTSMP